VGSQRPSRVAERKIKMKKRNPRRREKAPARRSSTGDAHTPPGHASPAARLMPDGRRPPRPLESAAAGACSSVACVQANAFPHSAPCTSTTALHSSARHTRRVEAKLPPAVNQSQPLGHAAPARPIPQRLRHDHLLSQATQSVGRERLRGRAASRRQERGSLAQLRVNPPPSRGAEQQCIGRVVRLTHHVEDGVWRAARHSLRRGLTETKGRSWPSASSLMRKASFAALVGAPLVTASSRRAACVRPLPAPKSGPWLGPRCASRLERAGCPVRAC